MFKPRDSGGTFLRVLPFAVMGVVALVDLSAGPEVGYLPLLSLAPAFASVSCGLRRTAWVGLLALISCLLLAVYDQILGTRQNNLTLASIVGVSVAAMLAGFLRERREHELAEIRSVAEVTQRVLLRPVPTHAGPLRTAVRYLSAAARARIGGDLYEVITTPQRVRLIIGDVQGKGLDAVETAAIVLGAFREAAYDEIDLGAVAARIGQTLSRQLSDEEFVTVVLAEVGNRDSMVLLNCGHPSPVLVRAGGGATFAEPPDTVPPLGVSTSGDVKPTPYEIPFSAGDRLLLYTDGLTEARDHQGRFYPLLERAYLLRDNDAEQALDRLHGDLARHVGGPITDDVAMLLLDRFR